MISISIYILSFAFISAAWVIIDVLLANNQLDYTQKTFWIVLAIPLNVFAALGYFFFEKSRKLYDITPA